MGLIPCKACLAAACSCPKEASKPIRRVKLLGMARDRS